jgi:hypothetical protein
MARVVNRMSLFGISQAPCTDRNGREADRLRGEFNFRSSGFCWKTLMLRCSRLADSVPL